MSKAKKRATASKAARSVEFSNEKLNKLRLNRDREKYIKEVSGKALSCMTM